MMIDPEMYKEKYQDKDLKELVQVRENLIKEMNKYEERKIINESNEILEEDLLKPSPSTKYYWYNFYLKEITDLIIEKLDDNK